MHCLTIEQLSFERSDIPVFAGLSATWQQGQIIQVRGHNGSGKTTLLRLIAGLLRPHAGSITWNGSEMYSYEAKSDLLYLGHQIGVDISLTAIENLQWFFALNGVKAPDSKAMLPSRIELVEILEKVGMKALADTPCSQMSAGQVRRVALARLYLSKARLWVLDEPFTSIDNDGVSDLDARIQEHAAEGGLVILTSHQKWHEDQVTTLDLEDYKAKALNWL